MSVGELNGKSDCNSQAERQEIARQVKAASTSFYGAMRMLPKAKREAIFAVYAFCRAVDDIADDEGTSAGKRIGQLDAWRCDIAALYEGQPGTLITRALAEPVEVFGLREADFLAVIDGMEMDARGSIVAPDMATLDLFCDRVASAVGRLCVCIFGEAGEAGQAVAHHLGRALQLTNIIRDVAEDAGIGRLYLPAERLAAHGIAFDKPGDVFKDPNYPALWREMAGLAGESFELAETALAKCDRTKMRPARIMLEVYKRNLARMTALSDADIANPALSKRLVSRPEKLFIALRHGLF